MPSVKPRLIAISGQAARSPSQNHRSNRFVPHISPVGGRGRGVVARERARGNGSAGVGADPALMRVDLPERWSVFVRRVFASRDGCAIYFGVTMQTACNWFDGGVCRPSGHVVAVAALNFPEAFVAVMLAGGKGVMRGAA